MADELVHGKKLLDIKVDSILSRLSSEDLGAWRSAKRNSDRLEIVHRNAGLFHREITISGDRNLDDKQVWDRAHKSASEAEELRRQGNELFVKGSYLKAIKRYNAAVVHAPVVDEQVGIWRGRSARQLPVEDTGYTTDQMRLLDEIGRSKEDTEHSSGSKDGSFNSSKSGLKKDNSSSNDCSKDGCSDSKNDSMEVRSISNDSSKDGCSDSKNDSMEVRSISNDSSKDGGSDSKNDSTEVRSISNDSSKDGSSESESGSKELALALANRSAALFHLKRYEETIRDIDYSLSFGYPRETRYKLYERRARACLQLGRKQEAGRDASDASRHLRDALPDGPARQKLLDSLEKLRLKCRETGRTGEMGERQEVGEKRKVGEINQDEEHQNGPDNVCATKIQMENGDKDSRTEDDGSKRFKERDEGQQKSKEVQTVCTRENSSKVNACTKCKRVEDGSGCWTQVSGSQCRPSLLSTSDEGHRSEPVDNGEPSEPLSGSFFAGLEVHRSELCGRYTVSKRDFRVGNVIARMVPFASVLYPDCHITHCYHCFREVSLPFPCHGCSQVVYCRDACSLDAWNSYHWAECGWMGWMTFDLVGRLGHLAYRMLVEAGLENILRAYTCAATKTKGKMEKTRNSETDIQCQGRSRDIYDAAGHATVDGIQSEAPIGSGGLSGDTAGGSGREVDYPKMMKDLVRHESSRDPSDDLGFCIIAFVLLQISKQTGWLTSDSRRKVQTMDDQKHPPNSCIVEERERVVLAALLDHIQTIQCNGYEITEMRPGEGGESGDVLQRYRIHGVGIGLYPDLATMNHSCDPTVDLVFQRDEVIIRAIHNIRASEEVTIDYGRLFFVNDRSERQTFLRNTYFFDCRCLPCTERWPLWKDLPASVISIKCPGCAVRLKALSTKECPKCGRVFGDELTKAVIRLDDSHHRYAEALRRMNSSKSPETEESELKRGVDAVEDHLTTMQELLQLPWRDFYSCQATLRQCYRIMDNNNSSSSSSSSSQSASG